MMPALLATLWFRANYLRLHSWLIVLFIRCSHQETPTKLIFQGQLLCSLWRGVTQHRRLMWGLLFMMMVMMMMMVSIMMMVVVVMMMMMMIMMMVVMMMMRRATFTMLIDWHQMIKEINCLKIHLCFFRFYPQVSTRTSWALIWWLAGLCRIENVDL